MKLLKKNVNVDLKTSTIGGLLKQIRKSNFTKLAEDSPDLIEVWVCSIGPKFTKSIIKFVESHIDPLEQERLHHLKRFQKRGEGINLIIDAILCTTSYIEFDDLLTSLEVHFGTAIEMNSVHVREVPSELPLMREIAQKWSSQIWPMAWKGNPNHQALLTADFDLLQEQFVIEKLCETMQNNPSIPFVTLIAEKQPFTGKINILHIVVDNRDETPLGHSIMNAIATVAREEKLQRSLHPNQETGYLCHNLLFYTSYEPCAMCSMALVHSRIGRLIYLFEHNRGALESSYFIGDRRDLNWTFDIWKWVGSIGDHPKTALLDHLDP